LKAGIVVAKDLRIQALEKTLDETVDAFRKSTDDCTAACNNYKARLAWFEARNLAVAAAIDEYATKISEINRTVREWEADHPKPQ